MATVPAPRTWTVGELLTAAKLNTDLRDGLNFLLAPPLAHLTKSTSQAIATATATAVTWDTEAIDRDGGHSTVTNTSRYTAQTAGWYKLTAALTWETNSGGYRMCYARKNNTGTELFRDLMMPTTSDNAASNNVSATFNLAVNDYVEIIAQHAYISTLNVFSGASSNGGGWTVHWIST